MDEVYGETEDLVARAIQDVSKKNISFQDIAHRTPAVDPARFLGILKEMKKFGALKSRRPLWGVPKGADSGPFYRVNKEKLARYRDQYAAPPPYEAKNKPLPSIPQEKPLTERPHASPQEVVQNIIQKDSEQIINYQANEMARLLDWPLKRFLTTNEEAGNSIADAASQAIPGTEGIQRSHQNPDPANGKYSDARSAQLPKGRAR
ncbi:hypothetical protein [Streptomyces chartreusis]|uniref:hypothetical protein n=1 Tax=Streptomyces chartreusis TaxID=1969 RepID=UPI0036CF4E28